MMNLSELLTSIKMDLGIYGLALPFKNADEALYDVIKLKTVKTFSPFSPQIIELVFDLKELNCLEALYTKSKYELPDMFGNRRILYIRNVSPRSKLIGNGYVTSTYDDGVDSYNGLMMTQANANLVSIAAPPITFKFEPPNIMYLYNFATNYGELDVSLAVEHAPNLASISPTTWETFYELANLDIQAFLYNTLKHYTEIQTAYGTINLKIDDWSSAASERKDMIEKMKDTFHLDNLTVYVV